MQEEEKKSSQAKSASETAREKLKEKQRMDEESKLARENEIAERHYKKMQKRREVRGTTYPKPNYRTLPSVEETPETVKENSPTETPSPVEEVLDDVVRDKARGKEALKMIAMASSKGIANVSKTIGSDVVSPLLSMAILAEAPILAAVYDKSISALKTVSSGIFGFAKGLFSKKSDDSSMPSLPSPFSENSDENAWQIDVIDKLVDINDSIEFGNELFLGLVEGLAQGVEDFREDMKNANKEVPNNDSFINQEQLLETEAKSEGTIIAKKEGADKNAIGGFFGFLNGGTVKKIVSLLMKITGVSFVLGILGKLSPFGKTKGGKDMKKGFKFLKGFGSKISKMMGFIMKPLRLLAGPIMTGLRFAFMGLMGVVTAISTPILIIIAIVAAVVLGLTLLARKMGDGDILKGFGIMWTNIKEFFTNLWNSVKDGFLGMTAKVKDFSSNLFNGAMEALVMGPSIIADKAMELIDFLASIPSKILGFIKDQVSKIPMVGATIAGVKSIPNISVVEQTFSGARDVVENAIQSENKMQDFAANAGKLAMNLNPAIMGGRLANRLFKRNDTPEDGSVQFVNDLVGNMKSDPLGNFEAVNQKSEAQKRDFMRNMIKTRENNYYERISKGSSGSKDVQINTSNKSVYNTTQVSYPRSPANIPKPVSSGY